jgi:prenyltransferase beta subunit
MKLLISIGTMHMSQISFITTFTRTFYRVKAFVYSCQSDVGGISKWPDIHPDVLHTVNII